MPIITLTTDFGNGSPYVATMKGVILSINPAVAIIDISHAVPAQDIARAPWCWKTRRPGSPTARSTWRWSIRVWAPAARSFTPASAASNSRPGQRRLGPAHGPHAADARLAAYRAGALAARSLQHVPRPRHHGPGRRSAEPGPRPAAARAAGGAAFATRHAAANRG